MNVSVSVMAHPSRKAWVDDLLADLGDVPVAWDTDGVEWHTGDAAWRLYDPDADWHVVIQDDAVLCSRFTERLADTLGQAPKTPVSLYLGTGRPVSWQRRLRGYVSRCTDGWIRLPAILWGVAVALPTEHVEPMLRVAAKLPIRQYDARISQVYEMYRPGTRVWYPMPSLVDHRDGDSLLGHGGVPRRAYRWIDG